MQKYFSLFVRGPDGFESWKNRGKNLVTHFLYEKKENFETYCIKSYNTKKCQLCPKFNLASEGFKFVKNIFLHV